MTDILHSPPIAFPIYVLLVVVLAGVGRSLAGKQRSSAVKQSTYAGGEASPTGLAVPGYRMFFRTALFFAVLHLGVLMLAGSGLSPVAGLYLGGLILTLIALMVG